MELVNVVCGDSSVLCCENSQNESTQFETTSEDPRASEETKEESIGKRTLRAAVKTVQLVRQESKKVVNYIDQEAGELVEAASELDEAKFEAAITCLLCGAETAIGAHVREAVAHGLSFAAGQAWVGFAWSLSAHSFSEDPSNESVLGSWLDVAGAVAVGVPTMFALSRHAADLSARADAALSAGESDAALELRTRATGAKALGTSGVASVLAGVVDNALAASLPSHHWGFGAARCLAVVLLVAALAAGVARAGRRVFAGAASTAHNAAESLCAAAAYIAALGVMASRMSQTSILNSLPSLKMLFLFSLSIV